MTDDNDDYGEEYGEGGDGDEGDEGEEGEEFAYGDDELGYGEDAGGAGGEFPEDYDYAEEGEDIKLSEINSFERTSISTLSAHSLKNVRNPKEKYKIILVDALSKISAHLTNDDKTTIIQSIGNRDDIIYKNPYLYILGYIGSNKGKGITAESMKKAFRDIGTAPGIEEPDVVRYSIFWQTMTKK